MAKIGKAFELVDASWGVLRQDKQLLVLPVISGVSAMLVIASFAYPVVSIFTAANNDVADGSVSYPPLAVLLTFVGYLTVTFVGMFFNSALIHAANERMEGGEPALASSIMAAWSRVAQIFVWALAASTVSLAIRAIQERLGLLGKILGFLAGTAWAVVTFLVLPIIIIEELEPLDAAKRSAELLRKSWGENLAGHVGFGVINLMVGALVIGFMILGVLVHPGTIILTLPFALFVLIASFIVISALSTVFQTALYRHAVALPVNGFEPGLMNDAFTYRKGAKNKRPTTTADIERSKRQQQHLYDTPAQPIGLTPPPPPAPSAGLTPPANPAPTASASNEPQDWSQLPDGWG